MLTVYSQQQLFVVCLKNKAESSKLDAVFQNAHTFLDGQAADALNVLE